MFLGDFWAFEWRWGKKGGLTFLGLLWANVIIFVYTNVRRADCLFALVSAILPF